MGLDSHQPETAAGNGNPVTSQVQGSKGAPRGLDSHQPETVAGTGNPRTGEDENYCSGCGYCQVILRAAGALLSVFWTLCEVCGGDDDGGALDELFEVCGGDVDGGALDQL